MVSKLDYAKMSADVYNDTSGGNLEGWKRVSSVTDENTGFRGGLYVNEKTKELVVSYAGTESGKFKYEDDENVSNPDWKNDWQMGWKNKVPSQTDNARNLYDEAVTQYASQGYDISVTGHSLGGVLAYIIASENNCHGETFNNPGAVGLEYEDGSTVKKVENVTENLSLGDVISMYGTHGENVEYANPDPFKITLKNAVHDAENGEEDFSELRNRYLSLGYHGINQWIEYLENDNNTLTLDAESLKPYLDAYTAIQTAITDIQKCSTQTISLNGTKAIRPYTLADNLASPVALDLNGDGIAMTSTTENYVQFDLDCDGRKERIGWVNTSDGFLAQAA